MPMSESAAHFWLAIAWTVTPGWFPLLLLALGLIAFGLLWRWVW